MSLLGAIGVVAALRGIGFVGMIVGVHTPIALLLPYVALAAPFVLGYLAISRGAHHRAAGRSSPMPSRAIDASAWRSAPAPLMGQSS